MSYAYLVIYRGKPEDPEAFLRYYMDHHIPIAWTFPKIRDIQIHWGVGYTSKAGDKSDVFMISRLIFDTLEDLQIAITSEERERARTDMKNFPPYKGTVERQIVKILEMSRG